MKKNILFFYSKNSIFTNAVRDYVNAFRDYSEHNIYYFNLDSAFPDIDLKPFDCIIFNFCVWGHSLPTDDFFVSRIRKFGGQKIAIFQDEYDYFLWRKEDVIKMGINTIVTCVPPEYQRQVFYGEAFDKVKFIHALTGYVPEYLIKMPPPKPFHERPWRIGYRSRPVPFRYGKLTQEKVIIGERMKLICCKRDVPVNIETTEQSRVYGREWPEFIRDCRAVLCTESGSNIFDFDGTIIPAIDSYLASHPDAEFDTVYEMFLAEHEGKIKMNQVSPRVFEAIALGTVLVMFEGKYSGVVRPWDHYIPLRKDFGNIDEVLKILDNIPELEGMARRAYQDIIASGKYHYSEYVQEIDSCISLHGLEKPNGGYKPIYTLMGWRTKEDGVVPVKDWSLSVVTDRPLKYTDWHLIDPKQYVAISFRWRDFTKCLWFSPLSHSEWKRINADEYGTNNFRLADFIQFLWSWPMTTDNEPVFNIIGWTDKRCISGIYFPAIKNAAPEFRQNLTGTKCVAIHCRNDFRKWGIVLSYFAISSSINSLIGRRHGKKRKLL